MTQPTVTSVQVHEDDTWTLTMSDGATVQTSKKQVQFRMLLPAPYRDISLQAFKIVNAQ